MINKATILLSVLFLVGPSFAQKTATAQKCSGITLDGNLTESCWTNATKIEMNAGIGMMLTDGVMENPMDASTEFALLWDDEGFYCGSWNKDDIHNAPWTPQPNMVNHAWKDDGHEYWVSFDFNDVWEDASPLYYGQFGWQIWYGWVYENGAPNPQYVAYRNDNGPMNTTVDDLKEQGFHGLYTSADGINFNAEVQFKWSGFFLGSTSTPNGGKELGFNLGLTDNDGGDMAEGWLRWAEGNHNTYQGWGKVLISDHTGDPSDVFDPTSIRLQRTNPLDAKDIRPGAFYDMLGRKIHVGLRTRQSGVTFHRTNDGKAIRRIVLR